MTELVIDGRGQPSSHPCTGDFCFLNDVIAWRLAAGDELARAQRSIGRLNGQELNALRTLQKDVRDPSVAIGSWSDGANYYAGLAQATRGLWTSAEIRIAKEAQDKDKDKDKDKDDPGGDDWELPDLPDLPDLKLPEINWTLLAIAAGGIAVAAIAITTAPARKARKALT